MVDDFTRACLAIEVDTSIGGRRVVEVLQRLVDTRRKPAVLITDNGPEFVGRALDAWAYAQGIQLHFIEPGKPNQNAYVESFTMRWSPEEKRESTRNCPTFSRVPGGRRGGGEHVP